MYVIKDLTIIIHCIPIKVEGNQFNYLVFDDFHFLIHNTLKIICGINHKLVVDLRVDKESYLIAKFHGQLIR